MKTIKTFTCLVGLVYLVFTCNISYARNFPLKKGIDSTYFKQEANFDDLVKNPPFTLDVAIAGWKRDSLTCLGLRSYLSFMVIFIRTNLLEKKLADVVEVLGKPNQIEQIYECNELGQQSKTSRYSSCYEIIYYYGKNCNENTSPPIGFDRSLYISFIVDAATSKILNCEGVRK